MSSTETKELKISEFISDFLTLLLSEKVCDYKVFSKHQGLTHNGIVYSDDIILTLSKDQKELSIWDSKQISTHLYPHATLSVITEERDAPKLSVILYPKEDTSQALKDFLGKLITDAQLILSLYSTNVG